MNRCRRLGVTVTYSPPDAALSEMSEEDRAEEEHCIGRTGTIEHFLTVRNYSRMNSVGILSICPADICRQRGNVTKATCVMSADFSGFSILFAGFR